MCNCNIYRGGGIKRNQFIDVAKGFTILLVVLGHCIQYIYAPNDYDKNIFFRVIYSFHMPFFMFLSGYLISDIGTEIDLQWLKRRLCSLVIPYVSWVGIGYVVNGYIFNESFFQRILAVIKSPDNGGLWFLWILFLNSLLLFIGCQIKNKCLKSDLSFFVLYLLLFLPIPYLGINTLLKKYFLFYIIGYIIRKYLCKLELKLIRVICCINLAIYPVLVAFWFRASTPYLYILNDVFNKEQNKFIEIILVFCYYLYNNIIVPFLGIGFIWILLYNFKSKILVKYLAYLGRCSSEIYILHLYFLNLINIHIIIIHTLIGFICGIIGSLTLAQLIKKNKVLSLLLFGKNNNIRSIK